MKPTFDKLEMFIFWSRWLQAPLYLGLIVAQGVYVYQFMHELAHLVTKAGSAQRKRSHADRAGPDRRGHDRQPADHGHHRRLRNLRLRLDLEGHPDQPEWLSHVNAGVLKVKLADGADQHLLDPPAAHLHQRRPA
jgi:hypothetical protein